jgi:ABC-type glycerol-3-phosphate transport system substrate-binding protein
LKGRSVSEGKQLGLPWARNGVLLLYNITWARELGFPLAPESTTGFRDQACAAVRFNAADSDRRNDGTGGWMVTGEPSELEGWLSAFGAEIVRLDGRGYQFDTPEARQAVDFLLQLSGQGCLWPAGDTTLAQALSERRALFVAVNLVDLPEVRKELAAAQRPDRWQVIPFPSPVSQPAVVSYGMSLILSSAPPERELAGWLFMRWLASPENQAIWAQYNYLFPSRRSALAALPTSIHPNQDWVAALEYLPYLRAEPYYASWQSVRWSLGDALNQIITPQSQPVQAVLILRMLDELAAEIHFQIR